jgi:predicted transcriptional regulator
MRALTHNAFGPLEIAVLDVFWARAEALTVRDVYDALRERGLAYTTIQATMVCMQDKGWLSRAERERSSRHGKGRGRVDRYTVAVSRATLLAAMVEEGCNRLSADRHDRNEALATLLGVAIKR